MHAIALLILKTLHFKNFLAYARACTFLKCSKGKKYRVREMAHATHELKPILDTNFNTTHPYLKTLIKPNKL